MLGARNGYPSKIRQDQRDWKRSALKMCLVHTDVKRFSPPDVPGALTVFGSREFLNLGGDAPRLLAAISCGAVFMGANTYIGNGPNFMVKAIAEENGVKMPSFFGYMVYSGLILIPIFVAVTAIFFRA